MDLGKGFSGIIDDAGFLHEIVYGQRGEEFCGSVRRQDMVRAGKIVTERLAGVLAEENSTGVMYLHHILKRVLRHDLEVLRCDGIYGVDRFLMRIGDKDVAEVGPVIW